MLPRPRINRYEPLKNIDLNFGLWPGITQSEAAERRQAFGCKPLGIRTFVPIATPSGGVKEVKNDDLAHCHDGSTPGLIDPPRKIVILGTPRVIFLIVAVDPLERIPGH